MQIQKVLIRRNESYSSYKPNQLILTVELSDRDGNTQQVALDDQTIVEVLEVIRDQVAVKTKAQAALAKVAIDSAIAAPALENATNLKLEAAAE